MSSYTQLLSSYLSSTSKSNNALKTDSTTRPAPYLSSTLPKPDIRSQYGGINQYIPSQYKSIVPPSENRNALINESSSIDIKKPDSSKISGLSQTVFKSSYTAREPNYDKRRVPEPQIRKNLEDIFSKPLVESPSVEFIKKRHEENTNRALNELLNFQPDSYTSSSSYRVNKEQGYSSILKEIDACVNDMKKYSARKPTVTQTDQTDFRLDKKDRYDRSADMFQKKTNREEQIGSSRLSTIQFRSQDTDFINNNSDILAKQPEVTKGAYQINHFLPQKKLIKGEGTQQNKLVKGRSENSSGISEQGMGQQEGSRYQEKGRENQGNSNRKRSQEENYSNGYSKHEQKQERENELENLEEKEENKDHEMSTGELESGDQKDNIYEFVKQSLSKEKFLKDSEELVEILAKTMMKIVQNFPSMKDPKDNEKTYGGANEPQKDYNGKEEGNDIISKQKEKGIKPMRMIMEKLESVSFLPAEKPSKELKTVETQTDSCEDNTPMFQKDLNAFPSRQPLLNQSHDNDSNKGYFEIKGDSYGREQDDMQYNNQQTGLKSSQEGAENQFMGGSGRVNHGYTVSFSAQKEGDRHLFSNNAQGLDVKTYLPQFESNQKGTSLREGSPSFLSYEKFVPDNGLGTQDRPPLSRKGSLPEIGLRESVKNERSSATKGSWNMQSASRGTFAKPKDIPQSERSSVGQFPRLSRSSKGNESSPNFFANRDEQLPRYDSGRSSNTFSAMKNHGSLIIGDPELQGGHRSMTNLLANDLRNNAEKSFLNKIQNMQQSFSNFLKQKIEEVQEANQIHDINREPLRTITPLKTMPNFEIHHSSLPKQPRDARPVLPKALNSAKAGENFKDEITPLRYLSKEDKVSEFPRQNSQEFDSLRKSKGSNKWVEINFQDDREIDKLIKTLI